MDEEFNLLSGIRSSAYESIVWEQLIGVHSASTISLFREATDCGIPIHLLNEENFDKVSEKLTLSESTMQTLKGHVESGKFVILPETELTMGDWSGTGYMVLDPDTYTGQYMVDGGLDSSFNGGVTSEAVDRAMFINFYMTLEDCVGAITLCCQLLRYIPAGGVVGALMMVAIVALGAYLIYTSIAYYQEAEDMAERYYAGDMAAGEELINRTAWDVTISIFAWAFGIGTYVNTALTRRAGASLTKTVGREAADKLMEGAKVPADLTKHVKKFLELGMTTEAITNLAETLKPVNFEKLGRLARQGMPIELLESLAKNERVLEEFDEVMLLLFKDSELDPDTIIRHLAEEGEDFVSRFVKHGDEVFKGGKYSKYLEQLDSFSENKINHIINGSKGSNHGWENLVPDKNWDDIKNIIAEVMETGIEGPYKTVYSKKAMINGFEVEVTYTKLSDGAIKISDAWINQ